MTDDIQWIRSRRAAELLGEHCRWIAYPESWLRDGLRVGELDAKARKVILERNGRTEEKQDWLVPKAVWAKGEFGESSFSPMEEKFFSGASGTGFRHIECFGLSFNQEQFLALSGITTDVRNIHAGIAPPERTATKNKGGAPPNAENWANLVGIMAAYLAEKSIPEGMVGGALFKELQEYADLIGAAIPSKPTAMPAMHLAMKWHQAPKDAKGRPLQDKDGNPLTEAE